MIELKNKNDSSPLKENTAKATLYWKTNVDLDLYTLFCKKGSAPKKRGLLSGLLGGGSSGGSGIGEVFYGNRTRMRLDSFPYITLDKDSGVGDIVEEEGFNEENMEIGQIAAHDMILIVANIYSKSTNFAQYGGNVTVRCPGHDDIMIPLTETKTGSWCVVAKIDNRGAIPQLINVNQTMRSKPKIADFM